MGAVRRGGGACAGSARPWRRSGPRRSARQRRCGNGTRPGRRRSRRGRGSGARGEEAALRWETAALEEERAALPAKGGALEEERRALEDHAWALEGRAAEMMQCENSCVEMAAVVEGRLWALARKDEAGAEREKVSMKCET